MSDKSVVPTPVGVNRVLAEVSDARRVVVPTPVGVNRMYVWSDNYKYTVVPTPVGVNRRSNAYAVSYARCPHARGGEPICATPQNLNSFVVPTPVGVNRLQRAAGSRLEQLSPRPWG